MFILCLYRESDISNRQKKRPRKEQRGSIESQRRCKALFCNNEYHEILPRMVACYPFIHFPFGFDFRIFVELRINNYNGFGLVY